MTPGLFPTNSADPCASVWSVRGSKRKPSNAAAPLIHQPDVWSPGEETRTEFWSGPSSSYGNNLQTRIWHVFIWIHMYTCLLHESLAYRIKPFHLEEIMMIKSKKWSTKSINPSRKEFSFHPNLQPFKIDASYVWFSGHHHHHHHHHPMSLGSQLVPTAMPCRKLEVPSSHVDLRPAGSGWNCQDAASKMENIKLTINSTAKKSLSRKQQTTCDLNS